MIREKFFWKFQALLFHHAKHSTSLKKVVCSNTEVATFFRSLKCQNCNWVCLLNMNADKLHDNNKTNSFFYE